MGVKGVPALRKLLRKVGKEVNVEVRDAIAESAEDIEQTMKSLAPRKEHDLVRSITTVTSSDGLSAKVAPGIRGATTVKKRSGSYIGTGRTVGRTGSKLNLSGRTKHDMWQFRKAYWIETGTKGRKTKDGQMVGAIRPQPFIGPTVQIAGKRSHKAIDKAVNNTLKRLSRR